MSTRRLFLPSSVGVIPVWVYGNAGGAGQIIAYPDGSIILTSADLRWKVLPNIYLTYGKGGKAAATSDPVIMPAGVTEAQALGLFSAANGKVNGKTLGTFVSPDSQSGSLNPIGVVGGVNQYAALPTSAVSGTIATVNQLICGGLFTYYYQGGTATASGSVAAIDLTTGQLTAAFAGNTIAINTGYGAALGPPKVFSDGAGLFGVYAIGLTISTTYVISFSAQPSGTGTIAAIKDGSTTLTAPLAQYGANGFNGPFFIKNDGTFNSAFASGIFSLAAPAPLGAGLFEQDLLLIRPTADPSRTGSAVQTSTITVSGISGSVITVVAENTNGGISPVNLIGEGGSIGGSFNTTFSTAAALAAAVGALFPDCSMTFVDGSSFGLLKATVTLTMPSGATYYPYIFADYQWFGSGPALPQTTGTPQQYIGLMASDGTNPKYYLLPGKPPLSSALAVNGSTICHVFNYLDVNGNAQWVITIPGVIRINVSLAYTLGAHNNGGFSGSPINSDYTSCPVSVIAFGAGFAVALPYNPVYSGTGGAPLKYTFSPAAASATTTLFNGPIFLLSTAGAVDGSFDTALSANFFSLGRTDGRRYGPFALAENSASNICFGSYYAAAYFDLAASDPTPTDEFGNLSPAPTFDPLTPVGGGFIINPTVPIVNQQGPGLEVFCCCDAAGAKILPP